MGKQNNKKNKTGMWNGKLVLRYIQKMESPEVRTEVQMVAF